MEVTGTSITPTRPDHDEGAAEEVWEDITETVALASQAMAAGEMIHGSDFSLAEAMSALELMDPKMDDGMHDPVESVQSRLDRGLLKMDDLTEAEALAIIQGLISHEVAFYEGGTLGESVFSCLYLHPQALHHMLQRNNVRRVDGQLVRDEDGAEVSSPVYALMAVVLGIFKTIHFFRKVVLQADIYEEEDCVPNSFGLYLGENVTDDDVLYFLTRAEMGLQSQSNGSNGCSSAKRGGEEGEEEEEGKEEEEGEEEGGEVGVRSSGGGDPVKRLLRRVVHCRRQLLKVMQCVHGLELKDGSKKGVRALGAALGRAGDKMAQLAASDMPTGLPDVSFAFDPSVLRSTKGGNGPRRLVRALPFPQALEKLLTLLKDMEDALDLFQSQYSLQQARVRLERLSRRGPNVLVNAFLHIHLLHEHLLFGHSPVGDLVLDHLLAFGVPLSSLQTPEGCDLLESFCVPSILEALRLLFHNRSRQRGRLEGMFENLAVLQDAAALADQAFRERYTLHEGARRHCFEWAFDETLRTMAHYVTLGFELDLYMAEELGSVHWYLDMLQSYRLSVISGMQNAKRDMHVVKMKMQLEEAAHREEEERRSSAAAGGGSRKKKKGKDRAAAKECAKKHAQEMEALLSEGIMDLPEDGDFREDPLELTVVRLLCRGAHLFMAGIRLGGEGEGGKGDPPQPKFCAWEERFFNRYKAFQPLRQPPAFTYADFLRSTSGSGVDAPYCLDYAAECFRSAKRYLDQGLAQLKEEGCMEGQRKVLKELARLAVANGVAVAKATLMKRQGEGGQVVVKAGGCGVGGLPVLTVEARRREAEKGGAEKKA